MCLVAVLEVPPENVFECYLLSIRELKPQIKLETLANQLYLRCE